MFHSTENNESDFDLHVLIYKTKMSNDEYNEVFINAKRNGPYKFNLASVMAKVPVIDLLGSAFPFTVTNES